MSTNDDNKPSFFARYIDDQRQPAQQHNGANLVSRWVQGANIKTFLMDILANGPVPATLVEERGAAHGFSKKQLYCAREQMNIASFKEVGKLHGPWYWVLPYDNRGIPAQQATPNTPYF
jgi:hypothetical protein